VCGRLFGYLEPIYGKHDLRGFFVTKMGVAPSPSTREYANAWLRLSAADGGEAAATEAALEMIYAAMLTEIAAPRNWPDWWEEFSGQVRLWTQSDQFLPAAAVFVPDDGELKSLFRNAIEFAWIPVKRSFGEFERFFHEFGAARLSESVEVSLEDADLAEGVESPAMLTPSSKRLIFTWLWNQHPEDFRKLVEGGQMERLLTSIEKRSAALRLKYQFKTQPGVPAAREQRLAFWDEENRALFLAHNADPEALRQEVAEALVRALWGGRNLKDLVPKVFELLCASSERAERLVTKRDWSLPTERETWLRDRLEDAGKPAPAQPPDSRFTPVTPTAAAAGTQRPRGDTGPSGPPRPSVPAAGSTHTHRPPTPPSLATRGSFGLARPPGAPAAAARQDRAISYVSSGSLAPPEDDESEGERTPEEKKFRIKLGRIAVEQVCAYEREHRREPVEMAHNHPGYDVESRDPATGKVRLIEVKAINGPWSPRGVALSRTQFSAAQGHGESFWLYVVEHAGDEENAVVHPIRNPASLIAQYWFDHGWRVWRTDEEAHPAAQFTAGRRMEMDGTGAGLIAKVESRGEAILITLRLDDGQILRPRPFNPATMRLVV